MTNAVLYTMNIYEGITDVYIWSCRRYFVINAGKSYICTDYWTITFKINEYILFQISADIQM